MIRTFIQTDEFVKNWKRLGLNDDDMRRLELEILKNPQAGNVIKGTGGLRKLRFAFDDKGKSGSVRICYVDFLLKETVYLITIYPKKEKDNFTKFECNNIKKMINILEKNKVKPPNNSYEKYVL